jgi:glycosyltransferase involved in cell wall biosynthesis
MRRFSGGLIHSLSIVFPAYNDAGTIASMVVSARRTARQLTDDFEILVVDDGSRDGTGSILAELEALVPELRVLRHGENRGYGAALRTGFSAATKELVFYTDGDAQFDPRELPRLVELLSEGVDYVSGYRKRRADPPLRVLVGNPYHSMVRAAFGLSVRDIDCDFRLFRRPVLDRLELEESDGSMCLELLKKLEDSGCRFAQAPVSHYPRVYGRSQYFTLRGVLRSYLQLFRLWVRLVVRPKQGQAEDGQRVRLSSSAMAESSSESPGARRFASRKIASARRRSPFRASAAPRLR